MIHSDHDQLKDRLISIDEICQRLKLSTSALYRIRRNPAFNFPPPVEMGNRRVRFSELAFNDWIRERKGDTHSPFAGFEPDDLMRVIKENQQ